MSKAKGYKLFNNFKIGMKVLVKNNKKQGRKGSRLEEDWLGPYVIHSILDNCVKVSRNGKVLENKIALIHIKPYKSPSIVQKHAQLSNQILPSSPKGNACFFCIFRIHGIWGGASRGYFPSYRQCWHEAAARYAPFPRAEAYHSPASRHCR